MLYFYFNHVRRRDVFQSQKPELREGILNGNQRKMTVEHKNVKTVSHG
jgi:hypothetical protein